MTLLSLKQTIHFCSHFYPCPSQETVSPPGLFPALKSCIDAKIKNPHSFILINTFRPSEKVQLFLLNWRIESCGIASLKVKTALAKIKHQATLFLIDRLHFASPKYICTQHIHFVNMTGITVSLTYFHWGL